MLGRLSRVPLLFFPTENTSVVISQRPGVSNAPEMDAPRRADHAAFSLCHDEGLQATPHPNAQAAKEMRSVIFSAHGAFEVQQDRGNMLIKTEGYCINLLWSALDFRLALALYFRPPILSLYHDFLWRQVLYAVSSKLNYKKSGFIYFAVNNKIVEFVTHHGGDPSQVP